MNGALARTRERVSRLRRMDPPEIRYRVREALRLRIDRVAGAPGRPGRGSLQPALRAAVLERAGAMRAADDERLALHYLRHVAAPRFHLPVEAEGWRRLRRTLKIHVPGAIPRLLTEADALARGSIPLLGRGRAQLGDDIDWHRDPFSGAEWPRRFWADYDLVAGDNVADPKVVHELNRHQHLPRLALAYALSGRERFASCAVRHLEGWIEQNPPGVGVNWTSSLEVGLRAVAWLWTILPLASLDALPAATAERCLEALRTHLAHIARYPSLYSSPNTHLLGEALSLFVGGVALAELEDAGDWRDKGRDLLVRELDHQVLPDGVHAELSSCYHCYSLDFYLQALALARRNDIELPPGVDERVGRQAEFVQHLTRADGTLPSLGDDDGGRALPLDRLDYRSFTDGLSTAAVLFDRPDLAVTARRLHAETVWLLGGDAADAFDEIARRPLPEAAAPRVRAAAGGSAPPGGCRFPHAGYCVQRAGAAHLVLDCGNLGRLGGGHGHADALAVVLHCGGTEMLVDPGTGVYNLEPEWRDHFRSTRAHNTLVVDDADQAEPAGTFGWATRYSAKIRDRSAWPGLDMIEVEHDGYRRLPRPVVHRRRVLLVDDEYWLVFDDVRGSGEHRYDLYYHLPAELDEGDLPLERIADGAIGLRARAGGDSLGIWVAATGSLDVRVHEGETEPHRGWISPRYGARRPAPTLRAGTRGAAPVGFVSALVPDPGDARVSAAAPEADGRVALRIERADGVDLVVLAPAGGPTGLDELEVTAELLWLRVRDGEPRRLLARNVSHIAYGDEVLIDRDSPRSWFQWDRTDDENGS